MDMHEKQNSNGLSAGRLLFGKIFVTAFLTIFTAGSFMSTAAAESEGPRVLLETSMGDIEVRLSPDKAPETVENFLRYVKRGFYDGLIFHRVIPNFMIQGGGFDENMENPGTFPPIVNEAHNGLSNVRGSIAMARTNDPDSAAAQFFINLKDNPLLDYSKQQAGYAVFGQVESGMEVVDGISSVKTDTQGQYSDVPKVPVVIHSARLLPR